MTELEKMKAGLEYNFFDSEVAQIKENAVKKCQKFNSIDPSDYEEQLKTINEDLEIVIEAIKNKDTKEAIQMLEDIKEDLSIIILMA